MKKSIAGGIIALALVVASFAPHAYAQTSSQLEAQIAALQAQIAALNGSQAMASFTADLTLGSSGAQVTNLQKFLIARGFSIPAGATGYFGAQTQAAVAAFQASNGITPAAGYFGPVTRAKANALIGTTPTTPNPGTGGLQGGAGSVDSYDLMSNLNNEEVGEDEEDVEVAGIEIEADNGSDLRLTAVRLVFDEGTATSDFEDYASEVALFLDGDEIARVDADEFNDDNDWTKTVSVDRDSIIKRGDTGELTVAITGARTIDSADQGQTWTVDFRQIRFQDADGATISEDPATAARTFSFERFAQAANVELRIREDDRDVNVARTIAVDESDDTDGVDALSFLLEARGNSDIELKKFAVNVSVTGAANTDDVITGLTLVIDGDEVARAETVNAGGSNETYVFEDVDYIIDAGDSVDAMILADFNSLDGALDAGDTISFSLGETETDNGAVFEAEDESGEELVDADITGSVSSGAFDLRASGIKVTFVSANSSVLTSDGADNDSGSFKIVYTVEAFGDRVYVAKTAAATTSTDILDETTTDGSLFLVDEAGVPVSTGLSSAVTFTTKGGVTQTANNIVLDDGEKTTITLTVLRTNDGTPTDDGLYRAALKSIGWATTDTTTWNVYDFDLEDYKTDYTFLN